MILELPFTSDAAQRVAVQLGAVKYQFDVRYNDRAGKWQTDIRDFVTQAPILYGLALVLGADLLQPFDLGIGSLVVNDEDGTGLDAGPEDLGVRIKVYWVSSDE